MSDLLPRILASQIDAALAMLEACIRACPEEHWDTPIARYPFWQVAYHTLQFTDLYLAPDEKTFQLRPDLHPAGWREFDDEYPSRRFTKPELERYTALLRTLARDTIADETPATLLGPSGHARRTFPRAELHLYNLRHIQHHTGQLSATLHKLGLSVPWISAGQPATAPQT